MRVFIHCLIMLTLPACLFAESSAIEGVVVDGSGAPVQDARVVVRSSRDLPLLESQSGAAGEFRIPGLPPGSYALEVRARGFDPHLSSVEVGRTRQPLRLELTVSPMQSRITVTARLGSVDDAREAVQVTAVRENEEILGRPGATIGNALENSAGIHVQQSTYGQVSPVLRGLTGYYVVNLIDGIRFNNSTFRSGPNQYLAYVEPSQAQRIEAVLGPASTQYGSDSLGGTIQVVTEPARFTAGGREIHGGLHAFGGSADLSGGAGAQVLIGGRRFSWLGGVEARRHNDLRAGSAEDSRNVFRRLFGLTPDQVRGLLGGRLQDSGFGQQGAHTRLSFRLPGRQTLTTWYQGSRLTDVRGYKDLLGGLGRLQSAFDPQRLHFFYTRYEKTGAGPLDSLSGTFSINSQRDGSVRQGLRYSDPLVRDDNEVTVAGYAVQAITHIGGRQSVAFGGDLYDEFIDSTRLERRAAVRQVRALYPTGSRYRTAGLFAQDTIDLLPGRVRAMLGGRLTAVRFRTFADRNPGLGVADSALSFGDLTFHSSLAWQANSALALFGVVSRGFRAPNLNDLGALGLNDLGYEVPAAAAAGALVGDSAGEAALASGGPVEPLRPERLFNYEAGLKFQNRRAYARVQVFDAEMYDPIVRRTLLFPAGSAPEALAGLPVTALPPSPAQQERGLVTVATAFDRRAVKAFVNDGRARYYGLETTARVSLSPRWAVEADYAFLAGRELNPDRPVRRLSPQQGYAAIRYMPSGRRPWMEWGVRFAGAQERLNGGDLDDERIGAARSRQDIADFFNGAVVAPYIGPDGVFQPTGETLAQLQNRVLPLGAVANGVRIAGDQTRVPLLLGTAGWYSLEVRGGLPLQERVSLQFAAANLLDRNYRLHGSGVDAPGFNAYVGVRYRF